MSTALEIASQHKLRTTSSIEMASFKHTIFDIAHNDSTNNSTNKYNDAQSDKAATSPFLSEHELVSEFCRPLSLSPENNLLVCKELDSGNGIADIVFLEKRKDWANYNYLRTLKPQWTYSLISLPYRKVFSTKEYSDLTCLTETSAEKVLESAVKTGICVKRNKDWVKVTQPRAPYNKIIAIEAKIRNWKRALYQASRYKEFAHESWVLLDFHHLEPAFSELKEFKRRNIGLAAVSTNGKLTTIFKPDIGTPLSNYRYWYVMVSALNAEVI